MLAYRLDIIRDDEGSFLVTSPDFPELTSFGDTQADAVRYGTLALEEAIAARIDDGRELPAPAQTDDQAPPEICLAPLPTLVALKVSLYRLIGESGVARSQLTDQLGWPHDRLDRLLRLDEPILLDELEPVFRALGSEIDFHVRPAVAA